MSANREEMFGDRMEAIKKTYKLPENIEKWYDETQTYGESFVYIVPYNKAFKKAFGRQEKYSMAIYL